MFSFIKFKQELEENMQDLLHHCIAQPWIGITKIAGKLTNNNFLKELSEAIQESIDMNQRRK